MRRSTQSQATVSRSTGSRQELRYSEATFLNLISSSPLDPMRPVKKARAMSIVQNRRMIHHMQDMKAVSSGSKNSKGMLTTSKRMSTRPQQLQTRCVRELGCSMALWSRSSGREQGSAASSVEVAVPRLPKQLDRRRESCLLSALHSCRSSKAGSPEQSEEEPKDMAPERCEPRLPIVEVRRLLRLCSSAGATCGGLGSSAPTAPGGPSPAAWPSPGWAGAAALPSSEHDMTGWTGSDGDSTKWACSEEKSLVTEGQCSSVEASELHSSPSPGLSCPGPLSSWRSWPFSRCTWTILCWRPLTSRSCSSRSRQPKAASSRPRHSPKGPPGGGGAPAGAAPAAQGGHGALEVVGVREEPVGGPLGVVAAGLEGRDDVGLRKAH
mmetsp:Transcript_86787/g.210495  ORF Transcript_86787/g.210495 Transcript_86787/m.210495 type:complete len:381 (+) Transcript_86787:1376-2518(+)